MLQRIAIGASVCTLLGASPALATNYSPGQSAPWFAQINETTALETLAKGGAGISIALVDTGVVASNAEIVGRVSGLSSCAAVSFVCPNAFVDDEGHGTATASIAAGQVGPGSTMSGVAPAATIISEKVLNASGSGTDADVASGITKAANAGAQVISLSLTYLPTSAVVTAINYAASKGAVIVYAAGNSSQVLNGGQNSTGFSQAALTHLIFAGSVSSANTLSSFSNTPGSGFAVAGPGSKPIAYASLWLMAPGENIIAPGIQFGSTAYASWTGTSMATPMVAGSIVLLDAAWPILVKNGTAVPLLLMTATDLGAPGVDNTYGHGLLNLNRAFQPVGTLSVIGVKGNLIPVSQIVNATLSSGALGLLDSIHNGLAGFTSFDSFSRNFTTNLTPLISKRSSLWTSVFTFSAPALVSKSRRLADGGRLDFASSDTWAPANLDMLSQERQRSEGGDAEGAASTFYMSLVSAKGTMTAIGRGIPATTSFAGALWSPDSAAAYQADDLGVSNALMGLAQGGYFAAAGAPLGPRTRVAMSWSAAPVVEGAVVAFDPELPRASALAFGLTHRFTARWTLGVTYDALTEANGLLGTIYSNAGPLSLGADHRSQSMGLSSAWDLGGRRSLLVDASLARTSGAVPDGGLIGPVSAVSARAFGVSLVQADAFQPGDRFTLSLRKPLRVTDGGAQLAVTSVDSQGEPITTMTPVSLRPGGNETDLSVGYSAVMGQGVNLNTGLAYRADADNVRGAQDVTARMAMSMRF
jgi:hypothetical protein